MKNDCEAKLKPSTQSYGTLSESSSTREKTNVQKTEAIRCNARTILCACPFVLLAFILFLGIPVVQIVIGSLYKNECPVNPRIPIYLIVTGVASLTLIPTVILAVRLIHNLLILSNSLRFVGYG